MLSAHRVAGAQEAPMSTRRLATCIALCAAALALVVPLRAITNGELDGNRHPAVVLLLMEVNGQPAFRCSGTLLSPTVLLTAGHCAGEPGEFSGMRVFTESDVEHGNNNYPFAGPNSVEAVAWASHPLFTEARFFLHDVGVVVLDSPGVKLKAGSYGVLPAEGELDSLQPRSSTIFTSVGYGLQQINPVHVVAQRIRMFAQPHLIQIDTGFTGGFSMLLSNNHATGGTCFGDSGGPNFLGTSNSVAGVTSFGRNGNCAGTGGVFRLDKRDVLVCVNGYVQAQSVNVLPLHELLHDAVELRDVDVTRVADGDAVPAGHAGPGQFSNRRSVQVPQDPAGPNPLVLRDREPGDSAGRSPLRHETPVCVEDLDALVVAVRHVDAALRVDHQIVRQAELAGSRAPPAPLRQILSVARVLHDACASVPVGHVQVAIGRERDVGRQVERVRTRTRSAFRAEPHDFLHLRVHLVDDVPGRVDEPDVALRIDAHRMRAA